MDELEKLLQDAMEKQQEGVVDQVFSEKRCTGCGEMKPYTEYTFTTRSYADIRAGIRRKKAQCRSCNSAAWQRHYHKDIEHSKQEEKRRYYKNKYNLTNEVARALTVPGVRVGPCPICREVTGLVLDHDHNTKQTRELICGACNSLLGYARENIDTLYNSIAYLKKHRGV